MNFLCHTIITRMLVIILDFFISIIFEFALSRFLWLQHLNIWDKHDLFIFLVYIRIWHGYASPLLIFISAYCFCLFFLVFELADFDLFIFEILFKLLLVQLLDLVSRTATAWSFLCNLLLDLFEFTIILFLVAYHCVLLLGSCWSRSFLCCILNWVCWTACIHRCLLCCICLSLCIHSCPVAIKSLCFTYLV